MSTLSTETSQNAMSDTPGTHVWSQVITGVLVVSGWVIVHYLTHTRERQKEIRELKSKLVDRILAVEQGAFAFHQAPHHNSDKARALVAEISRVSTAIAMQPLACLAVEPKVVRLFRSSVTLKNFEPSGFQAQSSDSALLCDISLRVEALIAAIENAYANRYLSKWWQTFRV